VPSGMPTSPQAERCLPDTHRRMRGDHLTANADFDWATVAEWQRPRTSRTWLARGARTEAEAVAAQRMRDLMGTISEGAYEAAWCQDLPDLLRPAVERLLAGQDPEFAVGNPLAAGATEVPDALTKLAAIAGRHRIWLRETDDPWDPLRVVPEAF
jgi:hypothetical protein